MTLYRQLVLIIIVLLVAGFIGTVTISTNNLRHFLGEQLASHAQDTATSLGLSLSPHMQDNDLPIMNSMIDAIFDRGYYKSINVVTVGGETLVERSNPLQMQGVPDWFIEKVDFQVPTAEAIIMSAWKQAGTIQVTSHPGYAYRELWENTVDTFWLFLLSALAAMLLALLFIRLLLNPLRRVEEQAEAICERSYPIQKRLPRTRELRRVVEAMNRLATKINSIFTEQTSLTERLREQAFKDPVTGLGNRRYFNRQLQNLIESPEESARGAVMLLELHNLDKINSRSGYQAGDETLHRTGELILQHLGSHQNRFAARISGAGFGIIATDVDKGEADALAADLSKDVLQLSAENLVVSEDIANIGVAMWKPGDSVSSLLSEVDIALRSAQSQGENTWYRYEPPASEQAPIQGAGQWHDFLDQVIASGRIALFTQPAYRVTGGKQELLHKEVLLRIPEKSGEFMPAGLFMPIAERIGLASAIDQLAVTRVLEHLASNNATNALHALNLTSTSLHDPKFTEWLCSQLMDHSAAKGRLVFELPEYGLMRDLLSARRLIERLAALGFEFGIDHVGRGFNSFGYLRSIKAHYLKIDGSYTREINSESDNQFFIQALADTAHSVDISVIAEAVESEAELETIKTLNVDGIQGYLFGKPEPV
ncbi:MAG: EAL domain-containing protein [Gammaproteobacteria bacterium]|nr:EAL domain-containing protein [Gammaproteobacteria bacterium]